MEKAFQKAYPHLKKLRYMTWDELHKEVEAWASDGLNGHIGALDPKTFELYKEAVSSCILGKL